MKKKMLQLAEEANNQRSDLERELSKKVEQQNLIESQQQFFEKMAKIETQTGESLSKLVEDELRKLHDKIDSNTKTVDKRMKKLAADIDIDKVWRQIDKKISREDALQKFSGLEQRMNKLENQSKSDQVGGERFEVSQKFHEY